MKFEILAEASERIRATAKKKEKISLTAQILRQAVDREIYLAGTLPSGKLGVGWATVQDAVAGPVPAPDSVELTAIQPHLDDPAGTSGPGSLQRKKKILHDLFARIDEKERRLLTAGIPTDYLTGCFQIPPWRDYTRTD